MTYETTYYWYIISEDEYGETNTGDTWDFTTIEATNQPPEKPARPSGKINGEAGKEYTYTSSTTDPEGSQLWYLFEWGDGTDSGWIGPYDSGATASASHSWEEGSYSIRVKARDSEGLESLWSERLTISMPLVQISIVDQYFSNLHFLNLVYHFLTTLFPNSIVNNLLIFLSHFLFII
jgi:hypothetical protein